MWSIRPLHQDARIPSFLLVAALVTGCATSMSSAVRGTDPKLIAVEQRIAIAPVQFVVWEKTDLVTTPPDERLAMLMVTSLERCLQERGYGAFFSGGGSRLLTDVERSVLREVDLIPVIKRTAIGTKLPELKKSGAMFSSTPRVLFPVCVSRRADVATRLLWHPGTQYVTYHVFLVDTQTGEIVSHNSAETTGNYQTIQSSLRPILWQRGKMSELIDGLALN